MNMAIKDKIKKLAEQYAETLHSQIVQRKEDMKDDDTSHYLIYRVLGIFTTGWEVNTMQEIMHGSLLKDIQELT